MKSSPSNQPLRRIAPSRVAQPSAFVEVFRFEISVTPQHPPIFMARHHHDLLYRKTSFKESACAFMAQVVKA